ncbi:translation initiation factor IF-2 [Phycisphaera mikurensis]|uniref:Translation initiation factor IF-2 n=1 Tax=Phycisphaera mikurensis (strain NBRC 102666 / KCTC 22515 / FYK2301M01) TaxID=1142394 RepID=I0IE58_PHYMF|nr:translation initiation factor IF-2 [Phycisphaera mikurensis]MBB6441350.1 translation initiation factor IF-2 [Phycisphaera mikurensis]BAM03546.1 translation initiation factor IF-2 [Phycisphaera mikurensis NBRC 102666]
MAKTYRIHQLAKELGVNSKAIVAKCDDEGVPDITNHMSVVKLGLAETIRQWFADSGGEDHAAVEAADKVDVEAAKKKVRKRASRAKPKAAAKASAKPAEAVGEASAADAAAEGDPAAVQAVTSPAGEPAAPREAAAAGEPEAVVEPAKPADAASQEKAPAEDAPAAPAKPKFKPRPADATTVVGPRNPLPEETEPAPEKVSQIGRKNVPDRPDVVSPAGEQIGELKKTKMSGPKLVRIEKPEPDAGPRPRRAGPPTRGPAPGEVAGISRSRGPQRGGGVRGGGGDDLAPMGGGGGRGPGGPRRGGPSGPAGGGGRRTLSSRRGGSGGAPGGPSNYSKADLDELDARLKGASGYMKQRRRDLRKGGGPAYLTRSAVQTGEAVEIEEPITIKSLSAATGIKAAQVIKFLFRQGTMATVNSTIDNELAEEVCLEYDIELKIAAQETPEQQVEKMFSERERTDVRPRPPVVTVLGHVDHGKTSLLDRIRKEDVAAHEDGGITQHVGAYRVTVKGQNDEDKTVVFLDTPGHAAFSSMRARGAMMTDIVVLVIAADDGVMPQTIESINHAKAADVPVVVALNKSDLPGATEENLQKIYGQLAEHGLNPSAWGGETEVFKTSAATGDGVPELLEALDLQAEVMELDADYGGSARGTVIEAEMQPGRGSVARLLVQDGVIKVGDFVVIGRSFGRVRDMTDDRGRRIKEAGPATPLELSGIDSVPDAGDKVFVTDTLKRAEDVAEQYRHTEREQVLASQTKVTLDNFADAIAAGKIQELRVVLKTDVQGSAQTLRAQLQEMGNDEVAIRVLHAGVGAVSESDVVLADASDAIIIGFHVTTPAAVRDIAEQRGVDIRNYRVIYDVTDDLKKSLEGMLSPVTQEEHVGTAEVKVPFRIGGLGSVAGSLVTEGAIKTGKDIRMRLTRDGQIVTDNRRLESLRRVKDEVKEVRAGTECGIRIMNFDDIKAGDELECYRVKEVARTLD